MDGACEHCGLTIGHSNACPDHALARQEGGDHYRSLPIQPIEFITKNGLGFCEGNVVKYVSRWKAKNGIEDLRKARHYIDLLIASVEG